MEPASETAEERFRSLLAVGEERAAAEWLVDRYSGEVFGLCSAMVRDRAAAEDLTQDAFGKAFVGLAGFRGEASSRTWMMAIARNGCFDYLRARSRDPWAGCGGEALEADLQPDLAPLPPDLLSRRDEVEAALGSLAEGERALVVLRFAHGLEYDELARAFGLRPGTVRMRISRALSRMRAALEAPVPSDLREAPDQLALGRGAIDELDSDSSPARARAAARPSAPMVAGPAPAPSRARSGLSGLFGLLSRREGAPEDRPAPPRRPHPLSELLAATQPRASASLLDRLKASAKSLGA